MDLPHPHFGQDLMEQEYFTGGMMSSLTSSTFRSGFDGARVLYRRHDALTYLIHISVRI